jgi:cytochrome c biogenesis protein ResB
MKFALSILALTSALAISGPVLAADAEVQMEESPSLQVDCEAGGGIWNDNTQTCDRG